MYSFPIWLLAYLITWYPLWEVPAIFSIFINELENNYDDDVIVTAVLIPVMSSLVCYVLQRGCSCSQTKVHCLTISEKAA